MKAEVQINRKGIHVLKYKSVIDNKVKYHISYYAGDGVKFESVTDKALTLKEIEDLDLLYIKKIGIF